MHVEVNETNIDKFGLVELTGNSREDLLNAAADATASGTVLSCNVPDDLVLEQNVFDVYESEHVDPARLKGCGYEKREDTEGGEHWVCVIHGKTSRFDVSADSHVACIQVDPGRTKEELEAVAPELDENQPELCIYSKVDDPRDGSVYICAVHGQQSKFDISRLPNMPCLSVEPMTPDEGDPHRA